MSQGRKVAKVSMKDADIIDREVITKAPKRFVRERVQMPDGYTTDWFFVDTPPSVLVVPVTAAGNLVMVRQYRHNLKRHVWEFPAGIVEPGEDIMAAASRELLEETGYKPGPGCFLRGLGTFYSLPSETNKETHVFLAEPVEYAQAPTGDAEIERYFDMTVDTVTLDAFTASVGSAITGMEAVAVISLARPYVMRWNREPE